MKLFAKAALGAVLLAGASVVSAAPAAAHVSIGIGIGGYGPGYYGRSYDAYCDPRSYYYDPYRCDDYDDGYYDDYYDGPVFIDGLWFNGPFRSRYHGGHREFYWHGGWHGGSGFHDGGFRRGGGYDHDGGGSWHGGGGGSWHGGGGGSWHGGGGGHGGWGGGGGHHH